MGAIRRAFRDRHYRVRRDYAVYGYLAEHGPCPAEEIAEKLHYALEGLAVDLAVLKTIWKTVDSEWEGEGTARRKLYRLTAKEERRGTSAVSGGSFWDDLNRRLEDRGFRRAYVEHSLRIQEVDAKANAAGPQGRGMTVAAEEGNRHA